MVNSPLNQKLHSKCEKSISAKKRNERSKRWILHKIYFIDRCIGCWWNDFPNKSFHSTHELKHTFRILLSPLYIRLSKWKEAGGKMKTSQHVCVYAQKCDNPNINDLVREAISERERDGKTDIFYDFYDLMAFSSAYIHGGCTRMHRIADMQPPQQIRLSSIHWEFVIDSFAYSRIGLLFSVDGLQHTCTDSVDLH